MEKHWWQEAVVYQIYPRSFQDSNGDGIGDLRGIMQHLDYLQQLGVTVLWLSPVYQSPNDDNGYDISDYEAIMADFGTMADFDELLAAVHAHGMRLIMDLVANHTSDEHPWFKASRASLTNPYRDYYFWRDRPNAWQSNFSGPAWQFDAKTKQYYLHLFSKKQPDLNWANAAMRQDIYAMMRRWLAKGIDGFRLDAINLIDKHGVPDDLTYFPRNGARVHDYLREMNQEVLSHYDIMTVGETSDTVPEEALQYAGFDAHELNMLFQFDHMEVDFDPQFGKWQKHPWSLVALKTILSRWQTVLAGKAWNSLYWNNHDQPRVVSRFGDDRPQYRVLSAKMLAAVLHLMQGTPYIYQGEELGMTNVAFRQLADYRDIETYNAYHEFVDSGQLTADQMMAGVHHGSRDNARTPMQWDDSANAGFTQGRPWIEVNPNYPAINAKAALADPQSLYYFYQHLTALRRKYPLIVYAQYALLDPTNEQTWCYTRTLDGQTLVVTANFTAETVACPAAAAAGEQLVHNYAVAHTATLRPYEVRAILLA
ncbi:alpha-glucosidase [Lacticaseibacillus jixianensis]|uniref:Alpha-glucosidase n=1 Tax=Lacticaseibacillus jixianensis TaxID=2486012 RepID=A0ABW4BD12_9LACO|nr:alpha-glucosidase [Lacticaseibacillus jixianensis]